MPKIDYQQLLNDALRAVAREALISARLNGLGEEGCFHIAFHTRGEGVVVPDFLKLRYPDTMTIVLQWTFSNLNVSDSGFGVTLQFDGRPYYIQVPFSEMTEFKDLSAEFMLQFQPSLPQSGATAPTSEIAQELPLEGKTERDPRILSMEEFRRRKKV
ncbi:MAG: ClpXP protease specificity-enhancing factor SspB [Rickettsiales bacterium]|jgi:hypothetical protein|nr:ClpXP protease specificity-enhancing factor SspB [Rickettsiales bacterium]